MPEPDAQSANLTPPIDDPLKVQLVDGEAKPVSGLEPERSVAPTTTSEEDLRTAGQRRVNMVWEYSQSAFAGLIVLTTCIAIFVGRVIQDNSTTLPAEWWTILGLVIGFYFGRTNHARIGDQPRATQIITNSLDDR
jgi:hypothetical protein